jgi:excinuclease UvrABC nuclease subunit
MKHFGSLAELRRATCAEIEQCYGINKPFAQTLHNWLQR